MGLYGLKVGEVVKMMEIELGTGWIFHTQCKVIDSDTLLIWDLLLHCLYQTIVES